MKMCQDEMLVEIEAIKQLKARYMRFGDTRQWAGFGDTLTEDVEFVMDAFPRPSKDAPGSGRVQGRDEFIAAMEPLLGGGADGPPGLPAGNHDHQPDDRQGQLGDA
jgi:hypothetical protein